MRAGRALSGGAAARGALGIRARLSLALGGVLLVATLAFGLVYANIERGTILEVERDHLEHIARIATVRLSDVENREALEDAIRELEQELNEVRDTGHEILVRDDRGAVVAMSHPRRSSGRSDARDASVLPRSLRVAVPVRFARWSEASGGAKPSRLVIYESLDGVQPLFQRSLWRHMLFAGGVVALVLVAAGLTADRMVVRPVRELAGLTDRIAQDGSWLPIAPSRRRSDEIGRLGDHLADLSRRLVDSVRDERYTSASLVATRVHQELDEPLRRIAMYLAALQELLPRDSDAGPALHSLWTELDQVTEILRGLTIPRHPPS